MAPIRVLLAGESWVSNSTHFKGWDFFSSTIYETGVMYLEAAVTAGVWHSSTFRVTWLAGNFRTRKKDSRYTTSSS